VRGARLLLAAVALAVVAPAGAQAPGYRSATTRILAEGRAASALIAHGSGGLLYAKFAPQFRAQVSLPQLLQVIGSTLSQAPVGAVSGESALPLAPGEGIYEGDYSWGSKTLAITLVFDARGRIAGGLIQERKSLPPDPHAGYRQHTRLRLPFDGTWWVFWGGATERQNYHVIAPDQRHAWDILVWRNGGTHRRDGKHLTDYWAFGRRILAPAPARVIEAVDGLPDNVPGHMDPQHAAGNHVVLDLGHGEYALIAHLRHGSVAVKVGDRVRTGQLLGRCGNSGNTSEPHVHFHVQDSPTLFRAKGVPVEFSDYLADGRRVDHGIPLQGQFVRDPGTQRVGS
jgi:murein DD-endopeptidase MepM/ murein hydrolase activator NlpD